MILILVAEIAVGCTVYAMKATARAETKKFLSSTIKDYYATPDRQDAVTMLWNNIMVEVRRKCSSPSFSILIQPYNLFF